MVASFCAIESFLFNIKSVPSKQFGGGNIWNCVQLDIEIWGESIPICPSVGCLYKWPLTAGHQTRPSHSFGFKFGTCSKLQSVRMNPKTVVTTPGEIGAENMRRGQQNVQNSSRGKYEEGSAWG